MNDFETLLGIVSIVGWLKNLIEFNDFVKFCAVFKWVKVTVFV